MHRTTSLLLLSLAFLPAGQIAWAEPAPGAVAAESAVQTTVLLGTWTWDLESNRQGSSPDTDLFWQQMDAKNRALTPTAGIALLGEHKLADIGPKELAAAKYQQEPLTGEQLRPGVVVAVKTREGNLAKLRVVRYRSLHDFDFPEARQLDEGWREFVRAKPDTKEYHLEVEWVLYTMPGTAAGEEDRALEVRKLLVERVEVAQQLYDLLVEQYRGGKADIELVTRAAGFLVQAEYDAAVTPAERLKALTAAVANAEETLAHAQRRVESGTGNMTSVKQAHFALLSAKLRLVQEQQRQVPQRPAP